MNTEKKVVLCNSVLAILMTTSIVASSIKNDIQNSQEDVVSQPQPLVLQTKTTNKINTVSNKQLKELNNFKKQQKESTNEGVETKEVKKLVQEVLKAYKPKEKIKKNFDSVNKVKQLSSETEQTLDKASQLSSEIAKELTKVSGKKPSNTEGVDNENLNELQAEAVTQKNINSLHDLLDLYNRTGFSGYNVSSSTGLTASQMDEGLSGTGLSGLGKYFISAEKEYGVSALALAGIAANESGWGNSNFAKTRYNYFGYQAYDSNPDAAKRFDSPKHSIDAAAYLLANSYLVPSGSYYNGVTLQAINIKYASDGEWAEKAMQNMGTILNKISN